MIQKFEEFITESNKHYKKFKDIKINDTGKTYDDDEGTVVNIGTAKEMAAKDAKGILADMISDGEIGPNVDSVLVKFDNGDIIAYVYGDDGFMCY